MLVLVLLPLPVPVLLAGLVAGPARLIILSLVTKCFLSYLEEVTCRMSSPPLLPQVSASS